jgi:hypothetical protein
MGDQQIGSVPVQQFSQLLHKYARFEDGFLIDPSKPEDLSIGNANVRKCIRSFSTAELRVVLA